ncbi:MAG: TldD/PmbA family protein [Prochloraceae cyanobacterium]
MTLAKESIFLTEDEARSLIESVIKQSEAEGIFVNLKSNESSLSRFSENQISQNISKNRFEIKITSYFGKSSATSSTTELDPEAITDTIRRSEELAKFAPEDPEWVGLLPPQKYENRTPAFDRATASLSPLAAGEIVQKVCRSCRDRGVEGSGTLSSNAGIEAIGNSLGLSAISKETGADFSFTAKIDNGSSWSNRTASAISQLPIENITEKVIDRAILSRNPKEIKPGIYPVIFEPVAFAELILWVMFNLDARSADEGRSFMSRTDDDGKISNRVGEHFFSPLINIQRDPGHPLLQKKTFFDDGLSNEYLEVVKNGIPQTLAYSRYWARAKGKKPTGSMFPVVMKGNNKTTSDLISNTERGILVSRSWYVRYVNPKTLEVTGMTRDGTFWIENGKIAYPIKNMRFNQSLPEMLRDVEDLTQVQRFGSKVVPGAKVKAFNFSSITDSV